MLNAKQAPSQAALAPRRGVMNIGQVLSRIDADFTGITASKIRFLEEKGLIVPARTAAGYRKYTEADVERLRFILALQRDQYLPLKVIKDYLDAIDRGEEPPQLPGGASLAPRSVDAEQVDELAGHLRPVSRAELEGATGASEAFIDRLIEYGLAVPDEDGHFDEHAVRAVRASLVLAESGIEPRHLRPFRTAADRELGIIESSISPLTGRKDPSAAARAADAAASIADAVLALHGALVRGGLAHLDR
ncbi:transcriptional regulator FtsR [Galactobacter valiniphilus]|uniref:transcriptional regulator FtsR n=1 Tax=Galactobacter valiniphilus TaxID=2676122 RepID=UPI0037367B15